MTGRDDQLAAQTAREFARRFGRPARWLAAAPGRVNLVGEHTDYNDGFVLPMAIDRQTVVVADRSEGDVIRIYSATLDRAVEISLSERLLPLRARDGDSTWSNYLRGVIAGFVARGLRIPALDLVVASTIPLGGGLASSAALEVAMATLLEAVTTTTLSKLDKARLCQKAEQDFAGVPCGIMDQLAAVSGQAGAALLIDCQSESLRAVPLSNDVAIIVTNTNVRHTLDDGSYARRRAECAEGARLLGVTSLRAASPASVDRAPDRMPDLIHRRIRHVVTENERTLSAAAALERGDMTTLGALMYESHASLRDDFEVSCAELDALVEVATALGSAAGVLGARMTGGGFGGCTITLVRRDRLVDVMSALAAGYQARTGRRTEPFIAFASRGAHMVRPV